MLNKVKPAVGWVFLAIILLAILLIVVNDKLLPTALHETESPSIITEITATSSTISTDPDWWNTAVVYQIFVRSFYDSNGDGIGDFQGIIEKLDYLNDGNSETDTDLGVTAIWLLPIYPSPSYHGYDVSDYYTVNPQYGSMEDFKQLIDEAHQRGIKVIIDLVVNHSSNKINWFQQALDVNSTYHDWYLWSENNPGYAGPWGQKVWHQASNRLYYYGVFDSSMPDLNYANEEVSNAMMDVAKYWAEEIGVDGFRIDGAKHLIEEGEIQANTESTKDWFTEFYTQYKNWDQALMTVGEVWEPSIIASTYIKKQCFDMVFNFDLSTAIISKVILGDGQGIATKIISEDNRFRNGGMATFLTNHDMNRVMSQFTGDVDLAKHAATILLTMPGTPFIYYGEEIGMVGAKPDELIRTPMQWSSAKGAGFSVGQPWEAPNANFTDYNVLDQSTDPESLLSLYRPLIAIRLKHPALLDGDYHIARTDEKSIYAAVRVKDQDVILTIVNVKDKIINDPSFEVSGGLPAGEYLATILFGSQGSNFDLVINEVEDAFQFTLPFAVQGHDNLVIELTKQ